MSSLNVAEDVAEMPNHNLTTRPAIAKIKHARGNTIMYSDPSVKPDPDARGIRKVLANAVNKGEVVRDDKRHTYILAAA